MRVLTLFLSAGKSLGWWKAEGLLSREILVYRELLRADAVDRVQIFTYDSADRAILDELVAADPVYARIDLLAARKGRGIAGVLRHRKAIGRSGAIKTNQVSGAGPAIFAATLTGVPLVLRMGYILSRRFAMNGQRVKAAAARAVEAAGARIARRIVVTSQDAATHFAATPANAPKVRLLPTYVDTSVFAAKQRYDFDAPVIAVCRFTPQKNLPALLRGCALAGVGLTLVGKGEGEAELRALAATLPTPVRFAGTLDNVALAGLMAEHTLFALPSLHEGLPKVLIEAMATGLICVASDIPGVTDLVEDGLTGYLIRGFTAEDIAAAIRRARDAHDPAVGARARAVIEARFGLTRYAEAEAAIYREIA